MTFRVRLIVTGDMEKQLLPSVLSALFQDEIEFTEAKLVSGATTLALADPTDPTEPVPRGFANLARALVTEVLVPFDRRRIDLVVAVDDLEVDNLPWPERAVLWMWRAVEEQLARRTVDDQEQVARRGAFFLLVPMPEAYLFADPAALRAAGVADPSQARVLRPDMEDFETDDERYLGHPGRETHRRPWYARHPKQYLQWLVAQAGGVYAETREGARALESLDWRLVCGQNDRGRWFRTLTSHIAWAARVPSPLGDLDLMGLVNAPDDPRRSRPLRNL
jgi:hypothetical protein